MIDFTKRNSEQGTLVIETAGKLDHDTNQYFFNCVQDEIEGGNTEIVINFAGLGHVGSVTLGSLVRAISRATKVGGTIYLACIENQILDVLRMMKLDQVFNIYATEADAITAIESRSNSEGNS